MFCCLLAALLLGPLGLWAVPRAVKSGEADCCADSRRLILGLSVAAIAVAILCTAAVLFAWFQPGPFRHICSVFVRP
jgi:hypothetical protein